MRAATTPTQCAPFRCLHIRVAVWYTHASHTMQCPFCRLLLMVARLLCITWLLEEATQGNWCQSTHCTGWIARHKTHHDMWHNTMLSVPCGVYTLQYTPCSCSNKSKLCIDCMQCPCTRSCNNTVHGCHTITLSPMVCCMNLHRNVCSHSCVQFGIHRQWLRFAVYTSQVTVGNRLQETTVGKEIN